MEVRAFAKINLFLEITGKRTDGYHDLVSVMQTVDLADELTVVPCEGDGVRLTADGALPQGNDNLAVRAAEAYFAAAGRRFGVEITLRKHIPMQAGLGGGSADAAAVLRALNTLDGDRFSPARLAAIGKSVGADVPFCVIGGTGVCRGVGERVEPAVNRLSAAVVVAITGEGVSTPWAFAALDEKYGDFSAANRDPAALATALAAGDARGAFPHFFNRFEEVILPARPRAAALKSALLALGAGVALMSGSGPAVFGLFPDPAAASAAAAALAANGVHAAACRFV